MNAEEQARRYPCATAGCKRAAHNGNLCNSCFRIKGAGLPAAESVWVARRLANVKREGECIIWQGAPNNMGYGKVSVRNDPTARGREEAVHRWFYKRFVGPIPEGLVLDHLCRTPLCVNVEHLEPVTQLENDRRGQLARGFGPDRETCVNGHAWIPENLRPISRKATMWQGYTCRLCNTENAREHRGTAPRGSRSRAEAHAARTSVVIVDRCSDEAGLMALVGYVSTDGAA